MPYTTDGLVGKLAVLVRSEDRFGADGRINGKRFPALLRSIRCRRHFRVAAFAERHVEDNDSVAGFVLFYQQRSGGDFHVSGVGPNSQNSLRRRPGLGRSLSQARRGGADHAYKNRDQSHEL